MANEKNLIPLPERAKDEQREIQVKGGKARAKQMKERKTIAEGLKAILNEKTPDKKMTKQEAILIKAVKKIFDDPDIRDIRTLAEVLGELKQNISAEGLNLIINTDKETAEELADLK